MIYINNTTTNIIIPCNRGKTGTEYTLCLIGMSNVEYEYALVDNQTSSLYYSFPIEGWNMPVGQYRYELYQNEVVLVASGLLQFGEFKDDPEQRKIFYNREITKIFYARQQQNDSDTEICSIE